MCESQTNSLKINQKLYQYCCVKIHPIVVWILGPSFIRSSFILSVSTSVRIYVISLERNSEKNSKRKWLVKATVTKFTILFQRLPLDLCFFNILSQVAPCSLRHSDTTSPVTIFVFFVLDAYIILQKSTSLDHFGEISTITFSSFIKTVSYLCQLNCS